MRTLVLAIVILLLAGCRSHQVVYETYVQANRTQVDGEAMVLVLIKDPTADSEHPDAATVNFVLRNGDSEQKVFRNPHYPSKIYSFTASREDERVVRVDILVEDGGATTFRSTQRFASWVGF